jgi:hypothetical protein
MRLHRQGSGCVQGRPSSAQQRSRCGSTAARVEEALDLLMFTCVEYCRTHGTTEFRDSRLELLLVARGSSCASSCFYAGIDKVAVNETPKGFGYAAFAAFGSDC